MSMIRRRLIETLTWAGLIVRPVVPSVKGGTSFLTCARARTWLSLNKYYSQYIPHLVVVSIRFLKGDLGILEVVVYLVEERTV